MLIMSDGEKHGMINLSDALNLAKDSSLDLVQVSPLDASPVVAIVIKSIEVTTALLFGR